MQNVNWMTQQSPLGTRTLSTPAICVAAVEVRRKGSRGEWRELLSEDLLCTIAGDQFEDSVDIDDRVVGLESVGDNEPTRRRLEEVPNRKRQWAPIIKLEEPDVVFFVSAQIR
nr:hypothetical protein CFP56_44188 [Quercus suber]